MWFKSLITFPLLLLIFIITCLTSDKTAQAAQIQHIGFDWSSSSSSSSSAMLSMIGQDHDLQLDDDYYDDQDESSSSSRRSLYWKKRYYISYGALSANRVPCPPRSGRSYYTHNCFAARAPANPYHRGCSCISRCRR